MSAWIFKRNTKSVHFMLWIYGKSHFADETLANGGWSRICSRATKQFLALFRCLKSNQGFFIWLPVVKKDFLYNPLRLETQITPVYCTKFAKASLHYSPHFAIVSVSLNGGKFGNARAVWSYKIPPKISSSKSGDIFQREFIYFFRFCCFFEIFSTINSQYSANYFFNLHCSANYFFLCC